MTEALSIDPLTGVVTLGLFQVGRGSTTRELRGIDPGHFEKQAADAENFFCRFAELDDGAYRIACQSYHRHGSVLFLTFTPFVPGETRDDATGESEQKKLAFLCGILRTSGVANDQDYAWGHVVAGHDGRSGITSLCVAYYPRRR